jgi:hypothetical protein
MAKKSVGALLTLRIRPETARSLASAARRRRQTRSEVARTILEAGLDGGQEAAAAVREARRQSLLVSRRRSEREAIDFVEHAADTRGWR